MSASNSFGGMAAPAPVDRAHLDRLATRFGGHFLIQLIDLFIAQGRERMEAAEQAIAKSDIAAIVSAAHALKSSAGNLGAGSLAQYAGNVERRGASGASIEALTPMVVALNEAFVAACSALEVARADVERRTA